MHQWKEVTLDEIADLTVGFVGKTATHYVDKGVRFIRSMNVEPFRINYNDPKFVDQEFHNKIKKSELNAGDVVIVRTGKPGACAVIPQKSEEWNCADLVVVKPKHEYVNSTYLAAFINLAYGVINAHLVGAVQQHFNVGSAKKLKIKLPPIDVQNIVGSFIDNINAKIEVNETINKNLSNLLQAIYQKRFGEVSLGAKQGILSDICSYSKEKVAVSELNVNTYFSTENMLPEKAGSTKATSLPTTPQTTACRKGDTLISNIRPYFKKIVYCEDMCGCSTDVLCFTPVQSQYAAYLFSTLYTDKFFAFMVAGSKGTKMPRGDKQQIMTYPVVVPAEGELEEFNAIAFPVLEQLNSNKAENTRLSALRDALLPKLMSGEIDISAIDL